MFKKLKSAAKKALSSKPITYQRVAKKGTMHPKKAPVMQKKFRQYGDKGYKPSNGRGVGY